MEDVTLGFKNLEREKYLHTIDKLFRVQERKHSHPHQARWRTCVPPSLSFLLTPPGSTDAALRWGSSRGGDNKGQPVFIFLSFAQFFHLCDDFHSNSLANLMLSLLWGKKMLEPYVKRKKATELEIMDFFMKVYLHLYCYIFFICVIISQKHHIGLPGGCCEWKFEDLNAEGRRCRRNIYVLY